jgi:hypothetical protein
VMKLGKPRRGDSADMSYIEFVDRYNHESIMRLHNLFFLNLHREGELRRANPARGIPLPIKIRPVPVGGVVMDILNQMKNVEIN